MKNNNFKATVAFALVTVLMAFANLKDVSKASYEAYLSGTINLWKRTVDLAEGFAEQSNSSEDKFKLLLADYGLLNATMKDKDEKAFNKYIGRSVTLCESLIANGIKPAECHAILSAMIGLKIAYSPMKGMFLGSRSSSHIKEALALDSESPIVQQLYGNHQNFTPEMWGGDPENAIAAYKKAISIYDKTSQENNWMYLDAHAWLGIVYKKQNKPDQAREVWAKIVAHEADFGWVKYSLLPSLDNTEN